MVEITLNSAKWTVHFSSKKINPKTTYESALSDSDQTNEEWIEHVWNDKNVQCLENEFQNVLKPLSVPSHFRWNAFLIYLRVKNCFIFSLRFVSFCLLVNCLPLNTQIILNTSWFIHYVEFCFFFCWVIRRVLDQIQWRRLQSLSKR